MLSVAQSDFVYILRFCDRDPENVLIIKRPDNSGGATNNPHFPKLPKASTGK